MVLCNVPFRPKGPKKYIVPTCPNYAEHVPFDTTFYEISQDLKKLTLRLVGYIYLLQYVGLFLLLLLAGLPGESQSQVADEELQAGHRRDTVGLVGLP